MPRVLEHASAQLKDPATRFTAKYHLGAGACAEPTEAPRSSLDAHAEVQDYSHRVGAASPTQVLLQGQDFAAVALPGHGDWTWAVQSGYNLYLHLFAF